MKNYLKCIIEEQINRGLYLKTLIPHPLKYPELSALAERCSRIIDDNVSRLKYFLEELENRDEEDIRDIYRGFRICSREMEIVEAYGIPALYYQTSEVGYLNKLIFKIHQEISLPLTPPSIACISTNYYYFQPFTGVIFVPLSETNFLLHLPDLFHEIGHEVLHSKNEELRLKKVDEYYTKAIEILTNYYRELLARKMKETGPSEIPELIRLIHSRWKDYWIKEFFCDLFACYTLGPAYVWSHLHLTTKKTEDVYGIAKTHPSDDARMKMLVTGLNKLGFIDEAKSLQSKWNSLPFVRCMKPPPEYLYAYPTNLMEKIAELFYIGLKESNFPFTHPNKIKNLGDSSIIKLLNTAWEMFWNDPSNFGKWEQENIQELKSNLLNL